MTNNKLNKYKKLKIYLNIIYTTLLTIFGFYTLINIFGIEIFELPLNEYITIVAAFCFIYIIIYSLLFFINIIFHEVGHLIFGLFAKLKFVSFNILGFTISKHNNKLFLKREKFIPGIYGYCNMETDDNIDYECNKIKLYYLGGIIFHFISIVANLIMFIFINNIYLDFIFIFNIFMNLYLLIYNILPCIHNSGAFSDGLHIIYYLEDNNYIKLISKVNKLQRMLLNETELKNIDSSFFTKPKTFNSLVDILNGKIYIDYIMSKCKYKEAINFCKKMLKDKNELLTNQDIITIKLQLILATFYLNKNIYEIKDIWNDDIKKHVDLMSKVVPVYIGINYLYFSLIEKNNEISNKYLNQFKKLNRKKYEKYQIDELEQLIFDVNKYNKKNH